MKALRGALFATTWILVSLAAAYDARYALENHADFQSWELNPLARWAAEHYGLVLVVVAKCIGVVLAAVLAMHCRHSRQVAGWGVTLFAGSMYGMLSMYYFLSTNHAYQQVMKVWVRTLFS